MDAGEKRLVDVAFVVKKKSMNVASYRIRCQKVIDCLVQKGVNAKLYDHSDNPKTIILSKIYDDNTLNLIINSKKKNNSKIILDLCDNHFIHVGKKNQILTIMEHVDAITVSSEYLAGEVFKHTGRRAIIVPDLIEDYNYSNKSLYNKIIEKYINCIYKQKKYISGNIVWFGNAKNSFNGSGMNDLLTIKNSLNSLASNYKLTIVSNSFFKYLMIKKYLKIKTKYIPFSIYQMKNILSNNKICIVPIRKDNFTMSKSANRIETALFYDLEVWADDIPAYKSYSDYINIDDWSNIGKKFKKKQINFNQKNEEIIKKWLETIS